MSITLSQQDDYLEREVEESVEHFEWLYRKYRGDSDMNHWFLWLIDHTNDPISEDNYREKVFETAISMLSERVLPTELTDPEDVQMTICDCIAFLREAKRRCISARVKP